MATGNGVSDEQSPEDFLDLIAGIQGRRMDDQHARAPVSARSAELGQGARATHSKAKRVGRFGTRRSASCRSLGRRRHRRRRCGAERGSGKRRGRDAAGRRLRRDADSLPGGRLCPSIGRATRVGT